MEQIGKARGPAYALRVEDLVSLKATVTAKCFFCGHTAEVDVLKVAGKWGKNERLAHIEDKLKCTKCDQSGGATFSISWVD